MPVVKRPHVAPTDDWQQLQLLAPWSCLTYTALTHIRCLRFCHRDTGANKQLLIAKW